MNAKALVVLLVALLGAAGFWFLSGRSDAEPAPHQPATTTGPAGPARTDAAAAQGNLAPAAATPAAAGTPDVERTEAPAVGAVAGGAVAMRGRLVDGKGTPRGGVVLAVRTWVPAEDIDLGDLPPPPGLGGPDRQGADRPTWTTRNDGTFQIPLAKDRVGALELVTERLVFATSEPTVDGRKGDKDLGDVTVLQEARVTGVVQDERGQPVAGVKVAATVGAMGFGASSSSISKADGTFALGMLRPGRWTVRTASGKFLPTTQEVELAPEEQKEALVLLVKPGNGIAGQVVDERGVGVAGMKVGSKRKEERAGVAIERFSSDEATTTDGNGYFTLTSLAEETASVRAFGPGHTTAVAADVPVGTGNLVLRVERTGVITGVLVGRDGAPIAGSRVRTAPADAAAPGTIAGLEVVDLGEDFVLSGPPGEGRATTAADGSFRLENVKPGSLVVTATGSAHRPVRSAPMNVLPAQRIEGVRLVADLGATARVTVKDEAGKPVAGATVTAKRPGGDAGPGGLRVARRVEADAASGEAHVFGNDEPLGKATTDEAGVASIPGLPEGEVALQAKHEAFAPATAVRVALPKSGVAEAALTMRQPGRAEILVLGTDGAPQSGVEVRVRPGQGVDGVEPKTVTTGDGGKVEVSGLVPGEYTVALARARSGTQIGDAMMFVGAGGEAIESSTRAFTVVAGQVARVELRRPVLARVHGVVTGTSGAVAGCVVALLRQDGDTPELPGFGGRNATTATDGTFAFDEVEAGRYLLEFGKREQLVKAQQECEVAANTADVRQDLVLRTGKVRVQAVAQGTGEPVAKAEVELVRGNAATSEGAPRPPQRRVMMVSMVMTNDGAEGGETTSMTVGNQRAFTDEDGVAEIDDVPVGDWTVRVKHRKHAPFELKGKAVVEGQLTDCGRVELGAAGVIRGKVKAADGKVVRMAFVATRPIDDPEWSEPVMAQGGSYRVQGLAAGKYKARVRALDGDGAWSPEVDVEVKAGETTPLDLQLPQ